jgi:dTDP-glucose 4,6-dehydratase
VNARPSGGPPKLGSYRNRRVLVTGAGGFIGSNLTERLVREGARVRAFLRYNSRNFHGWLEDFEPDVYDAVEVVTGDLKDPEAVHRAVEDVEIVFHLGALIAIPYSYVNPMDFVQTNVLGTAHVLDACRVHGVERLVHTSTSEVYGTAQYVPIDEKHPVVGQSPYSASKIAADQLSESYHRAFDLPVTVLRPFNTFGPRQSARAVIPTIITQCYAEERLKLGSLHPTRDLTFVDDTVEGFLRVATADGVLGEVINLGTGREISIGDLAQAIIDLTGSKLVIEHDAARVRPAKSEVERLCSDNSKAKRLLGWTPQTSLEDGLAKSIPWFEKSLKLYKTGVYNV